MTDELKNVKPGQTLTDAQKEALAKSNLEATSEAHRLAAEHRARDERGKPVTQDVADSIKQKLEKEEFQKPE